MFRYKQNTIILLIVIFSCVLAFLRIHGLKSEIFQALAHLFVGGLLATWITLRITNLQEYDDTRELSGFSALVLSMIELACFFLLK